VATAASIVTLGLALQPDGPVTRPVVVAGVDLPAGHALALSDLAIAQVPAGVLPAGTSTDSRGLIGRVLAAPLARGEAITEHRFTTLPEWAVPPGTMPMPVRFADPAAAALLTAGQRVDVVAASGPSPEGDTPFTSAELVAQDILVLAVISADPQAEGFLPDRQASGDGTPLVLLAADRGSALAIAGAQERARLGYLMHLGRG
jgi:Flp pilus assembly protein CpaB